MIIRDARDFDLPAILAIHNDAILTTIAISDESPADSRIARPGSRRGDPRAFLSSSASRMGRLIGSASFGDFRAWSGYRHSVEHSVDVAREHRRQGAARLLLEALALAQARSASMSWWDASRPPTRPRSPPMRGLVSPSPAGSTRPTSIGRWLDLVLMLRRLDGGPAAAR